MAAIYANLLAETRVFVRAYMSQPQFDASHDYSHILRVLALSKNILNVERAAHPSVKYDATIIELCALLHDVADHKYLPSSSSSSLSVPLSIPTPTPTPTLPSSVPDSLPTSNPSPLCPQPRQEPSTNPPTPLTPLTILLSIPCSCPLSIAQTVQEITSAISYSTELRSPALVQATLRQHPELAIVQDADRLDALGAVGIGRAFTFAAARGMRGGREGDGNRGIRGWREGDRDRGMRDRREGEGDWRMRGRREEDGDRGMRGAVDHFAEKLERLEGMMKTDEGRRMARERTRRLEVFRGWWEEEERDGDGDEDEEDREED